MNKQDNKILVFDKFLGYNVGGAQRSLYKLLKNLEGNFKFLGCNVKRSFNAKKFRNEKWQVERFGITEFTRLPYFEYWLQRKKIKKNILNYKADVLITQGLSGAVAARFFPGKVVYFIRDEYQLNRIPVYQTGFKKFLKYLYLIIQIPFIWLMFKDNRIAIKKADVVIANSQYIQKEIKYIFNKDSELIYPLVDIENLKKQSVDLPMNREFITSIGSEMVKGRKIVEEIAKKMPEEKFMIVGREFDHAFTTGNISYEPWSKNVLDIYKKTKLLLVPSVWNEAFGRVTVEGLSLNIPVLGSNRGGIPEVLPTGMIVNDLYSFVEWKEKIEANFNKVVDLNLDIFSEEKQKEKFKNILQTL